MPHGPVPNTIDDEAFARRLAAEDGVDVSHLERSWQSNSQSDRTSSPLIVKPRAQVIDVDAESESEQGGCLEAESAPLSAIEFDCTLQFQ